MLRSLSCISLLVLIAAVTPAQVIFTEDFNDNSAGWTLGPQWGIGAATAGSACDLLNGDPGTDGDGKAGGGIAGVVIGGCTGYALHGQYYLESPVIDTTGSTNLKLEFDRFLQTDYPNYMFSVIEVWNGATWTNIFLSGGDYDNAWVHASYNITAFSNPRLRVRWGYAIGDPLVFSSPSWNIDNVRISNGEYFFERFSSNAAGWTLDTEWGIGNATAGGGGDGCFGTGDPGTDADGTAAGGLAGVVIGGNAAQVVHGYYFLTSPPINTSGSALLRLQYGRFLNSDYDPFMHGIVQVWNGATWNTVFVTGSQCTNDTGWITATHDISAYSNAALQVRFGFDIGDPGVYSMSQWNLDNVSIHDAAGACTLQLSAYNGPGSLRVSAHCLSSSVPPGTKFFNCFTLNGAGPGWFFGINPSLPGEVIPQYNSNGLPFIGFSNGDGDVVWNLPGGVPPGIPVYGVTVALSPAGYAVGVSPPIFYVTP